MTSLDGSRRQDTARKRFVFPEPRNGPRRMSARREPAGRARLSRGALRIAGSSSDFGLPLRPCRSQRARPGAWSSRSATGSIAKWNAARSATAARHDQCGLTGRGEPRWQNVSRGILDPAGSLNLRCHRHPPPPPPSPLSVVADLHCPESLFNPELTCESSPVSRSRRAPRAWPTQTPGAARSPPGRSRSMPAIWVREARSSA